MTSSLPPSRPDPLRFPGRTRWTARHLVDTPLGRMQAVRTATGLAGLWFDGQAHHPGALEVPQARNDALFQALDAQLARYWDGEPLTFDLALDPQGTPFQLGVWGVLGRIASGQTRSYGELASELARPGAARAVGAAVGRNPLSILIPCHRVLGQDGALTGYAGGLDRKVALLRLEHALPESLL